MSEQKGSAPRMRLLACCCLGVTLSVVLNCSRSQSIAERPTCDMEAANSLKENSDIQPWTRSFSRPGALRDSIDKAENGPCTHLTGRNLARMQAAKWSSTAALIAVTTMISFATVTKSGGSLSDPAIWVYQFKSTTGDSMLGVVMNKVGVQRVVESKLEYSPHSFHSIGPDWKIDATAVRADLLLPIGNDRSAWVRQAGILDRSDVIIEQDRLLDSASGKELTGVEKERALTALREHTIAWRHELWIK